MNLYGRLLIALKKTERAESHDLALSPKNAYEKWLVRVFKTFPKNIFDILGCWPLAVSYIIFSLHDSTVRTILLLVGVGISLQKLILYIAWNLLVRVELHSICSST